MLVVNYFSVTVVNYYSIIHNPVLTQLGRYYFYAYLLLM